MLSPQKDKPMNFLVIHYVVLGKVGHPEKIECAQICFCKALFELIELLDIISQMPIFFRNLLFFAEKIEEFWALLNWGTT